MMNQTRRPALTTDLQGEEFLHHYYLKEELVAFCRAQGLRTTGSKEALTKRIAHYLTTKEVLQESPTYKNKKKTAPTSIHLEDTIEADFVCTQTHRAFFKEQIGPSFSFPVQFQTWLKEHTGKTYADAIVAYHDILKEKKQRPTTIDPQFEYNTYIRAFFADQPGKSLKDAIACWKYKKQQKGSHAYGPEDLIALDQ